MLIGSNSAMSHTYHQKAPEDVKAESIVQESGKAAAKTGLFEATSRDDTVSFLSNAMEELLANKIGVDKQKLDELKEEIEALEGLENPTLEQKERLLMLTEKLEKMVQEAVERTAEKEAKREPKNKLQTYRDIEVFT